MRAERSLISSAATVNTVVRRLGYVGHKAHEALVSSLTASGQYDIAEAFNNAFKPLVDLMMRFDVIAESRKKVQEELPWQDEEVTDVDDQSFENE